MPLLVESANIRYGKNEIEADYLYNSVRVETDNDGKTIKAIPKSSLITFKTETKIPKVGCMLIGWGGNNGSTVTAAILANKMKLRFETKEGIVKSNYFGSLTQASTVFVGIDKKGKDIYYPMKDLVPMVNPNDIIIDGWDISKLNLSDSMKRAKVIDINLQNQLSPLMKDMKPRKALFDLDFVAENQLKRADNVIETKIKLEQIEIIRQDIRDFKKKNQLDKVIVLWTANTERFVKIDYHLNGTKDNLMKSIERNESEISPSTLYAVASILEGSAYINGSPQNTFVPGLIELAEEKGVFIAGDDFKSGQTKFKSVIIDFLVSAGIKPCSIVSYNHLGNNDGYNLSAPLQFRSKEISKSNVVDDMVESNDILYGNDTDLKKPDHCVVIKYVPYVGDSKRALDEFTSELMLGGRNTIVVHNTCEDSLLASPIIIDLIILTDLFQRVTFKVHNMNQDSEFKSFNSVLSVLSYLLKAPLVEKDASVVNALFKQRGCIENILRALISLPPVDQMHLRYKVQQKTDWYEKDVNKLIL